MDVFVIITGIWVIGIFIACCIVTSKTRHARRQISLLREMCVKDEEV